jgi:hypothetical protein
MADLETLGDEGLETPTGRWCSREATSAFGGKSLPGLKRTRLNPVKLTLEVAETLVELNSRLFFSPGNQGGAAHDLGASVSHDGDRTAPEHARQASGSRVLRSRWRPASEAELPTAGVGTGGEACGTRATSFPRSPPQRRRDHDRAG